MIPRGDRQLEMSIPSFPKLSSRLENKYMAAHFLFQDLRTEGPSHSKINIEWTVKNLTKELWNWKWLMHLIHSLLPDGSQDQTVMRKKL